jgi:hypothetical protein
MRRSAKREQMHSILESWQLSGMSRQGYTAPPGDVAGSSDIVDKANASSSRVDGIDYLRLRIVM